MQPLEKNIEDILSVSLRHSPDKKTLIVFDGQSELARLLKKAYVNCLPQAQTISFDNETPEKILEAFEELRPGDLAVLIQSTSFRLNAFRIRVELFKKELKVIEHPHLARMTGQEIDYYTDSLAYDPSYYRRVGPALKSKIDRATKAILDSDGEFLVYDSTFEPAKLNIGDYTDQKNIGGQFPIGEVFTEPTNLESVNGKVNIAVFGDTDFRSNRPKKPMTLTISKGRIQHVENSIREFDIVLEKIAERETDVWIRELGFGMNRAFTVERMVSDIGTYERMCGIHLSLGAKHGVYKKPGFRQRDGGFHVDVFPITKSVKLDGEVIFKDGTWIV